MVGRLGRRAFVGVSATAALAGCIGVLGSRERERVGGLRREAPYEREWAWDLSRRDRIIFEYRPSGDDPGRVVIRGPNDQVLLDETVDSQTVVRHEVDVDGPHTLHFAWGSRARVDVYLER